MRRNVHAAGVLIALALAQVASAQSWRTVSSARQTQGNESALQVNVEYGAGRLHMSPAEQPFLYQLEARYDSDRFTPITQYDAAAGSLRVGMEGRGRTRGGGEQARMAVSLSRVVPMGLKLQFGAGEAELDLGGLSLRSLDVSTGASETRIRFDQPNRVAAEHVRFEAGAASLRVNGLGNARAARYSFQGGVGETTLDFGGEWTRSATASAELGIGSLTLRFPRSLGVRITKNSFLTSFDSSGMIRRGNAFYSRSWDTAPHKLSLDVSAALGSIQVEWIDR
ncbi:hypothetical protein BH20GEM3_BH20GEM3_01840 [soil metagenome]